MTPERGRNHRFVIGLARAFAGAILFSFPLLMTMEMWWLGSALPPERIAVFLGASIPLLIGLSYIAGFEATFRLQEDAVDAIIALGVGFAAGAFVLGLLGLIRAGMPADETVGRIALQAVPGAFGALIARDQLRAPDDELGDEQRRRESSHLLELFTMAAGALFLALAVAPTVEVLMLAWTASAWQLLLLMAVSLVTLHAFAYALNFRGQAGVPEGIRQWSLVLRYTVPGYALALLVSLGVLWVLGRADGLGIQFLLASAVMLGFPASLGAAAARLIL